MAAPLSDDDKAFIRAILDHPDELTTWLAYADWLDDRGDPRSEFLRLTAERRTSSDDARSATIDARIDVLREELDPNWILVFETAPLANCRPDAYVSALCPGNSWDRLAPTDAPDIRICRGCHSPVFFALTAKEATDFVSCGQVVALSFRIPKDQLPDEAAFNEFVPDDSFY
jgi:uncharacterized protein (TIGR02996 family)